MADLPLEHPDEEEGVEIDDPELIASIEAGCNEIDRGEYGRTLDEILAEFRERTQ